MKRVASVTDRGIVPLIRYWDRGWGEGVEGVFTLGAGATSGDFLRSMTRAIFSVRSLGRRDRTIEKGLLLEIFTIGRT